MKLKERIKTWLVGCLDQEYNSIELKVEKLEAKVEAKDLIISTLKEENQRVIELEKKITELEGEIEGMLKSHDEQQDEIIIHYNETLKAETEIKKLEGMLDCALGHKEKLEAQLSTLEALYAKQEQVFKVCLTGTDKHKLTQLLDSWKVMYFVEETFIRGHDYITITLIVSSQSTPAIRGLLGHKTNFWFEKDTGKFLWLDIKV